MVSAIANGGTVYRPWVVKKIVSLAGDVLEAYEPEVIRRVDVKPETLAFIRQAMLGVVNEGTGARSKIPGVPIGGKTGTAQVVKKGDEKRNPDVKDHAWFASFAPVDNPKIAVVVLVENGGFGGLVAAPVAKAVYEAAFRERPSVTGPTAVVEAPESELED
jgi:penicillin-binding protein 2